MKKLKLVVVPMTRLSSEPVVIPMSIKAVRPNVIQTISAPSLDRRNCVRVGPRVNIRRTVPTLYSPPTIVPARIIINTKPMLLTICIESIKESGKRKGDERLCILSCFACSACTSSACVGG